MKLIYINILNSYKWDIKRLKGIKPKLKINHLTNSHKINFDIIAKKVMLTRFAFLGELVIHSNDFNHIGGGSNLQNQNRFYKFYYRDVFHFF